MTAEEYIRSKRVEDCSGGYFYYRVSEEVALKAVEMVRNEQKQASQWISVKDILPKENKLVLVLIEYCGDIQIQVSTYIGNKNWSFGGSKIIAWMPIPSFDEILEDNKDVLKRLKDK